MDENALGVMKLVGVQVPVFPYPFASLLGANYLTVRPTLALSLKVLFVDIVLRIALECIRQF